MSKRSKSLRAESNYDRWKYTVSLKEWLENADRKKKISIKELYNMIAKITGESYIYAIDFIRESGYYVAHGEKSDYKFVLEKDRATVEIVIFYKDHYESYDYKSKQGEFQEVYFYSNNSNIENIFFCHQYNSYFKINVFSCDILNYKLKILLAYKKDLPFYQLVNNHLEVFEELFKFNPKDFEGYDQQNKPRSAIEDLFKVIKAIHKQIKDNVSFEASGGIKEWIEYLNGKIVKMRVMIDENYVIMSKEDIWWEEDIGHYEEFRCRSGIIFDGKNNRVTDEKLIAKIKSCFRKAKDMYARFQNELN